MHEALVHAKNELLIRGWWQRDGGLGPNGEICLGRALTGAYDHSNIIVREDLEDGRGDALDLVKDLIGDRLPSRWNDTPGRTFEEVIDVLDRAIIQTAAEVKVEVLA